MSKAKVLVVDDSVVVRKLVSDILNGEPDIEVVGTAANGKICLQKVEIVNPDIITLDIEMPEMNGIEALNELHAKYPKIKVIMFSAATEQGAAVTLSALQLGASDYVTKPSQVKSPAQARDQVRSDLVSKIRSLLGMPMPGEVSVDKFRVGLNRAVTLAKPAICGSGRYDIVCIGVSTGGPNALAEIIPKIPKDLGVPIVMVQHMPPMFTKILAERLSGQGGLPVKEATDMMPLESNVIYLAPGDFHMEVVRMPTGIFLRLNQEPHENSCRPAVDPLFRSVASVFGSHVLGVILTGMGRDGCRGCEVIKEAGGEVIVQDQSSSVVWGMPGAVAEAGLASGVYPLSDIPGQIALRLKRKSNLKSLLS
jgi:two-component system chemotaxis response regulator CheB